MSKIRAWECFWGILGGAWMFWMVNSPGWALLSLLLVPLLFVAWIAMRYTFAIVGGVVLFLMGWWIAALLWLIAFVVYGLVFSHDDADPVFWHRLINRSEE